MKRILIGTLAAALVLAAGCAPSGSSGSSGTAETLSLEAAPDSEMSVSSSGIVQGYIDPAYGSHGDTKKNGIPVLSLPLDIADAPEDTVCFAIYMDDPDSRPLCGYNWVHWMAVNITQASIPEDFSRTAGGDAVQGTNDNGKAGYAGPMPPDKDHTYVVTVYALDAALSLAEGFTKTEFADAITGHVLASASLEGTYRK